METHYLVIYSKLTNRILLAFTDKDPEEVFKKYKDSENYNVILETDSIEEVRQVVRPDLQI